MGFKSKNKFDNIEELPLLAIGDTTKVTIKLEDKTEDDLFFEDEFREVNSKNRVSQWGSDAIMIIITHTQIFLLLFSWSLNLQTPWSYQFTAAFSWMLIGDYWSWYKVESAHFNVTVWPTENGYAKSENIPIPYHWLTWGCCVGVVMWVLLFCCLYVVVQLVYRDSEYCMHYGMYLKKWFIYTLELGLLPFGTYAVRWWWCRYNGSDPRKPSENRADVMPNTTCVIYPEEMWPVIHAFGPLLILIGWQLVPAYILSKIKPHVFTDVTIEHEGFILLKETEYVYGINDEWLLSSYYLHSSYRRKFVYMRFYMFVIKFLLLIVYGVLFDYEQIQAFVFTGIFFVLCILIMLGRPYRLFSFNIILFLSFFVNFWNAFVGVCIEIDTRNAFIQEDFLFVEMIILNWGFFVLCLIWLCFLYLRWKKIIVRVDRPMWPNLTKTNTVKKDLDELTRKYLVSIIRAQLTLRETYNTIPLLAPAHELSRRIKILNAYCREAMLVDHVFQHTMWDITDELIQAHTAVFKKSIFSSCSLHGSGESAKQLYEMLPTLAKRLKQRDEDLILMSRKRRRILLKMYTLSVFLSKHVDRVRRELAVAKENKGYDTDSEFEGDDDSQEYFPAQSPPTYDDLYNNDYFWDDSIQQPGYSRASNMVDYSNADPNTFNNQMIYSNPNVAVDYSFADGSTSNTVEYVSSRETPLLMENSFEKDISALLDNSVFETDAEAPQQSSTPQRSERLPYSGTRQAGSLLSPSIERPATSPYHNNQQVLSFRKVDDSSEA